MLTELDHLLDDTDVARLAQRPMEDLRQLRDRLNRIEAGLSYGRRMAQGRLDIVMCELERRSLGGDTSVVDLLGRLPEVLAQHTRGGGIPRPVRDEVLPEFADDIVLDLDRILTPTQLGDIAQVEARDLSNALDEYGASERALSAKRHEVHRLIDEIQDEIVGRYRSGAASVDDLLR